MDESRNATPEGGSVAEQLAKATQSLAEALRNINGQFESLHAKIDRIVAAVEQDATDASETKQVADLEKANHDLKAQAARGFRKTLSPVVTMLLAKEGVEGDALIESSLLEKALTGLSIEQRIAVKGELARAGILV